MFTRNRYNSSSWKIKNLARRYFRSRERHACGSSQGFEVASGFSLKDVQTGVFLSIRRENF